jgi:hypothetical protein
MSRIAAVLDRIEAEQQTQPLPEGIGALELLQMVYRGEFKATPQQMRAAIEALPFEAPKLSAIGVHHLTGEAFAQQLERAVNRSELAKSIKMIEAQAIRSNRASDEGD